MIFTHELERLSDNFVAFSLTNLCVKLMHLKGETIFQLEVYFVLANKNFAYSTVDESF